MADDSVVLEFICIGLRVSTKDKKIWGFKRLGSLNDRTLFVAESSRRFSCGAIYHITVDANDFYSFYKKSIGFHRPHTIEDVSDYMVKEWESDHFAAVSYFENLADKNRLRRLEKELTKDFGEYTLNELKEHASRMTRANRLTFVSMIIKDFLG